MNIRKTLLLTLVVAIAVLGLTLTGCEKKSEPPTPPTTEEAAKCPKCGEDAGSEACCMTKAVEEAKDAAEKPAADHPGH